jgi:carboxyl-terminal processing protease
VLRGTTIDPHVVDLTREAPTGNLATSKRLPGGEGYVRVASFEPGAAAALRKEVDALKGTSGIVIDLRGVADGSLDEGIAAARHFVKSGVLTTLAGRGTERTQTTAAAGDGAVTAPVVLLVSNGTANAAELVGEPTTGLAAVQRLVKLPENHGLWMTYARYLTPDGKPISEHGLRPDAFVESPAVAFGDTPPTTDEALTKAVERLKGKK